MASPGVNLAGNYLMAARGDPTALNGKAQHRETWRIQADEVRGDPGQYQAVIGTNPSHFANCGRTAGRAVDWNQAGVLPQVGGGCPGSRVEYARARQWYALYTGSLSILGDHNGPSWTRSRGTGQ